jgi:hypothetical protein
MATIVQQNVCQPSFKNTAKIKLFITALTFTVISRENLPATQSEERESGMYANLSTSSTQQAIYENQGGAFVHMTSFTKPLVPAPELPSEKSLPIDSSLPRTNDKRPVRFQLPDSN